jgi:5-methylcytosine-specific restriction endonuclease McrA
MRAELHAEQEGRCAQCGRVVPLKRDTFIRDHTIPLGEGGLDIKANTKGLCKICSDVKTQQEAKRGMHRGAFR